MCERPHGKDVKPLASPERFALLVFCLWRTRAPLAFNICALRSLITSHRLVNKEKIDFMKLTYLLPSPTKIPFKGFHPQLQKRFSLDMEHRFSENCPDLDSIDTDFGWNLKIFHRGNVDFKCDSSFGLSLAIDICDVIKNNEF